MIVRARPKFITEDFFIKIDQIPKINDLGYYFNLGSKGLYFLLKEYSIYKRKKLNIALQSFNCNVVIDAVLDSGNNAYLYDIKESDFSLDYDFFKDNSKNIDVLILTHYQGLVNTQYIKIAEYCNNNNIFLIDDLAHADKIYIENIEVGSLSNAVCYSFAFDKPYTCYKGGEIRLKNVNIDFLQLFKKDYSTLLTESNRKSNLHVKMLNFLYLYTDPSFYSEKLEFRNLILSMLKLRFNFKFVYFIIGLIPNIILKILNKLLSYQKDGLYKLCKEKIDIINYQRYIASLGYNYEIPNSLKSIINLSNKKWNRYSVIPENHRIKELLMELNLQTGNFNWPNPLHILYKKHKNVRLFENYLSTEKCAKNILNIPIWQYIKLHYNDK